MDRRAAIGDGQGEDHRRSERAKQARLSFDVKYEQFNAGSIYGGDRVMSFDITIRSLNETPRRKRPTGGPAQRPQGREPMRAQQSGSHGRGTNKGGGADARQFAGRSKATCEDVRLSETIWHSAIFI